MLALVLLVGAALLGACVTRRVLRGALEGWEHALWGTVAGWMLAAVTAYALARWQGRLTGATVAWTAALVWLASAVLLLAPAALRAWRGRGEDPRPHGTRRLRGALAPSRRVALRREHAGLAALLVLWAPVYWLLFSTHTFAEGAGGVYSGGSAWYDLSFHVALASSFLHGENFPPAYTPLVGEPLLYPFMPDFQAATLMAAGLSMRAAMLLTALPLSLATTGIFYSFALRLARRAGAAVLATFLFLLNGGLGFVEFLRDWRESGRGLAEFWGSLGVNYANLWERGIHWTNVVTDTLLPQRASLYGLPAGLMILTAFALVWRRPREEPQPPAAAQAGERTLLLFAGVLAGLLPLFHTHTFVAVGLVSVFLFLSRPRRVWLAFWAPALLLAAPQLFGLARHAAGGGIVRLQPGWMGGDAPSFPLYLLRNFGVPLLLAVPAWLAAPRAWKRFYAAFALLFAFALVVVVSPNVFDNGKLTYYWHAVNSVFVACLLMRGMRGRGLKLLAAPFALLCVLFSVATGVLALQGERHARALLFGEADLAAARFVRERTAPRALFLTAPVINQPVLCLAGRPVVRGATDWLWAHGYEFRAREADVRRIYAGAADARELLRYYGIEYVYMGEEERRAFKADEAFFERNFRAAYRGQGVTIYEARSVVPGPEGASLTYAPRELSERAGLDPYALLEEFPRTSFFVYRILKVARGRAPRRDEFMEALKIFGRGLYVGAPGWERDLEASRLALASQLAVGDGPKAQALLLAADDAGLYRREYDTAYVLVHFFGYLGRDPDAPPDRDLAGLYFWLDVLRRTRDYRSISRAFLESQEYKNRALLP